MNDVNDLMDDGGSVDDLLMEDADGLMNELLRQRLGEANGVPALVAKSAELTVNQAHNFINDDMTNITIFIERYNAQISIIEGAIKSLPEENQIALIPAIDIPDQYREGVNTLPELLEKVKELRTLNQGGLNFLSNKLANGYKVVHADQDSILEALRQAKLAQNNQG